MQETFKEYPRSEIQPEVPNHKYGWVYFLYTDTGNGDETLAYVGQTTNLYRRLGTHMVDKPYINKIEYCQVPLHELNEYEEIMTLIYKPLLNSKPTTCSRYITLKGFRRLRPELSGRMHLLKRKIKNQNIKEIREYFDIQELTKIVREIFLKEMCDE